MAKNRKPRRNRLMATVAKNDHKRFRQRVVKSEKGKGRKNRPRQNQWSDEDFFLCAV